MKVLSIIFIIICFLSSSFSSKTKQLDITAGIDDIQDIILNILSDTNFALMDSNNNGKITLSGFQQLAKKNKWNTKLFYQISKNKNFFTIDDFRYWLSGQMSNESILQGITPAAFQSITLLNNGILSPFELGEEIESSCVQHNLDIPEYTQIWTLWNVWCYADHVYGCTPQKWYDAIFQLFNSDF